MQKRKKKHIPNPNGRPVKNTIEPIKDTPENVAVSIMQGIGKKDWNYLKNK